MNESHNSSGMMEHNARLSRVIISTWHRMWIRTSRVLFQRNNITRHGLPMPTACGTIIIYTYLHLNRSQVNGYLDHYRSIILYASIAVGQISLLQHIANVLVIASILSSFSSFTVVQQRLDSPSRTSDVLNCIELAIRI